MNGLEPLKDGIADISGVLRGLGMMFALWFVVAAFLKTKSLLVLLVSLTIAGAFVWALANPAWFRARAREEANRTSLQQVTITPARAPLLEGGRS